MNLFECIGGGGSSELQETVLWTNSSPTSSFATQTVTLSDDINNYDYIGIYYRVSTSVATTGFAMTKVSDYVQNVSSSQPRLAFAGITGTTAQFRNIKYDTDTTVVIGGAIATSGASNNNVIPTAISGLKYAKPKPSGTETVLWTNSDSTVSFTAQDITLSDSASNYRYIKIKWRGTTTSTDERAMLAIPSELYTGSASGNVLYGLGAVTASSTYKMRGVYLSSPTVLHFNAALNWGGANTTMNTSCVPTQVIGIS